MSNKRSGFTLVEMVIVVVVIGILVSIVILSFGAWRDRTGRTELEAELRSASSAIKNYQNFNNAYPTSLSVIPYSGSSNVTLTYTLRPGGASYCLNALSKTAPSLPRMYINSTTGIAPTATSCS